MALAKSDVATMLQTAIGDNREPESPRKDVVSDTTVSSNISVKSEAQTSSDSEKEQGTDVHGNTAFRNEQVRVLLEKLFAPESVMKDPLLTSSSDCFGWIPLDVVEAANYPHLKALGVTVAEALQVLRSSTVVQLSGDFTRARHKAQMILCLSAPAFPPRAPRPALQSLPVTRKPRSCRATKLKSYGSDVSDGSDASYEVADEDLTVACHLDRDDFCDSFRPFALAADPQYPSLASAAGPLPQWPPAARPTGRRGQKSGAAARNIDSQQVTTADRRQQFTRGV